MDQHCIICNEPGSNLRKIERTALDNLIQSSKRRKDQKYRTWSTFSSAFVHKSCSTKYNRTTNVQQAVGEQSKKSIDGKNIVKSAAQFNFKSNCFICGEYCDKKSKKISMVTKTDTKDKIIAKLAEKKN